jgi:hypothetical protein
LLISFQDEIEAMMNIHSHALARSIAVLLLIAVLLTPVSTRAGSDQNKIFVPLLISPEIRRPDIINPGFEQLMNGWTTYWSTGLDISSSWLPHTGFRSARIGDGQYNRKAWFSQLILVPAGSFVLQYWQNVESIELCPYDESVNFDFLNIYINNVQVAHEDLCLNSAQETWELRTINLGTHAGESVTLKVEFQSDETQYTKLYLDDFSFTVR